MEAQTASRPAQASWSLRVPAHTGPTVADPHSFFYACVHATLSTARLHLPAWLHSNKKGDWVVRPPHCQAALCMQLTLAVAHEGAALSTQGPHWAAPKLVRIFIQQQFQTQLTLQPPSTYGGLWSQSMSCCSERLVMFLLAMLFRHSATATDAKLQQQPHCSRTYVCQPRKGGSKHNADAIRCFLLANSQKLSSGCRVGTWTYLQLDGG